MQDGSTVLILRTRTVCLVTRQRLHEFLVEREYVLVWIFAEGSLVLVESAGDI